jgi:hypothetical protein
MRRLKNPVVRVCEDSRIYRHFLAQRRNLGYDLGDEKLDRRELRDSADEP